jgi:hypothetical protein
MHAFAVVLFLTVAQGPRAEGPTPDARGAREQDAPRMSDRDRCIGAGAAGAAGAALGLVIGGGIAYGISEIVRISDPANTQASKNFAGLGVPFGAIAGGMAGLAAGTIGAWELTDDAPDKPGVFR